MTMKTGSGALIAVIALLGAAPDSARAADANPQQIYITTSGPSEGVRWYSQHMKCEAIPDRPDAAKCGPVELVFMAQPTQGSTQGTGLNHISFSFADLRAKMAELEKVGVGGTGVRLQRFADGSTLRDEPGVGKHGFIFDPWGTRIELVEDPQHVGFHHIHLSAIDPAATLTWYHKAFGGKPAKYKGQVEGLQFNGLWVLASRQEEGKPATTEGRAVDRVAFVVADAAKASADLRKQGSTILSEATAGRGGANAPKWALVAGPDNVRLAVVEPGFTGPVVERAMRTRAAADPATPYATPKTPWGEPDLQGIYTGNSAAGIPLERPKDLTSASLTPEQATARQERRTLSGIWGYEREWRDIVLDYVKTAPSTQVAMIIDTPDGRLPPLTPEGQQRAAAARRAAASEETAVGAGAYGLPKGPEELSSWVRCITRGLPGMMMPSGYNNGLQITQGPGFVAIQKEMIHETRVIPTKPRPRVGSELTSWLGDSQGRWEGDTLVVETVNFNGGGLFQGASAKLKLTERFRRISPTALEYAFTMDDPATWTRPWSAMFVFDRDEEQYELVEYSCHEGNYGLVNILAGARAEEKEKAAKPAAKAPARR